MYPLTSVIPLWKYLHNFEGYTPTWMFNAVYSARAKIRGKSPNDINRKIVKQIMVYA